MMNLEYRSSRTRWSSLSIENRSVPTFCICTMFAIGVSFGRFLGCAGCSSWHGLHLSIISLMSFAMPGQ